MPFFAVFKRYEVWLLFLLIAGLFWLAFTPSPVADPTLFSEKSSRKVLKSDPKHDPATAEPDEPNPNVVLREVHVQESSGGQIVETQLAGISPTGVDLKLDSHSVQAIGQGGDKIPLFFEPFQKDAILTADKSQTVTLRWWMVKPEKKLTLTLAGTEIPVDLP